MIHAGDLSMGGTYQEIMKEMDWLAARPHDKVIFTPGNHDIQFEKEGPQFGTLSDLAQMAGLVCLIHRPFFYDGLMFFGSPWTPRFGHGWAYNADADKRSVLWDDIPSSADVVITHGPPQNYGDKTYDGQVVGCEYLRDALVHRIKPKLHIFGHIHEAYGVYTHPVVGTTFVNASVVNLNYQPVNAPIVIDL